MPPLFDVFVDPALRARQDQLDATWKSLNAVQGRCNGVPDSTWVQFVNDFKNWQEFYDSGSDWSSSSKTATDEWQRKAQDYSAQFKGFGCAGTLGNDAVTDPAGNYVGSTTVYAPDGAGVPGVKDPPPDEKGPLDKLEGALATAGWVAAGLVLVVIIGIFYVATRPTLHAAIGRRA